MNKNKKVIISIVSIISIIAICCLLVFFLFKPRDKVSYDIEKWKNLENKYFFLPSVDELGKYTDLNFKFFHKDMLMFESDAYVFYHDVDLDYIGSSFPDFLIEDCGWE